MKTTIFNSALLIFLFIGCAQPVTDTGPLSIANEEYVELSKSSLSLLQSFNFDDWGEMLADDVEYYFPDGDPKTRTELIGKEEVVSWWNNWKNTSGVTAMEISFEDMNVIPVHSDNALQTTTLSGNYTFCWFTLKLSFNNGQSVNFRMNMVMHFNDENKINCFWTYYDRTGIIQAMGQNILANDPLEVDVEE